MAFKILVVEDETDFREVLVEYLQLKGFEAAGIESIAQYQALLAPECFDLVVLDRTLPDGDGLTILAAYRQQSSNPVIILSGLGAVEDRVHGLEADADYYLVKPVKTPELLAIVNRYARKIKPQTADKPAWVINAQQWELTSPSGITTKLTNLEMGFLSCFKDAAGTCISRDKIISELGYRPDLYDIRRMQTLVSRLRQKVKEAGLGELPLESVYGNGYVYNAPLVVSDITD